VTGATGYVGGRLVPRLLDAGHEVNVLVRDVRRYAGRPAADRVHCIEADLLQLDTRDERFKGFDAAYYLVHSMLGGKGFDDRDRRAAGAFATAVCDCPHVIYLGGLLPSAEGGHVSEHLTSRAETGKVLRQQLAERVTEFRAGPVIGSGSASFEMVRYLTERLPIMITPRWVKNQVQPIAIRDVLTYLQRALDVGPSGIVEIGADVLTFQQMMEVYAACRGLTKRIIIRTPLLAPGLAARWCGFFTPIPNRLAVPLVHGLVQPLTAETSRADELFADVEPMPYREAVERALARTEKSTVETRWSGALGASEHVAMTDEEGLIREVRRVQVSAPTEVVYRAFSSLGGRKGWLVWGWAWTLRGWIDKLVGGPGLRRGRRDPVDLHEGESLDFWRVERVYRPALLRLRAEMKVPGKAWLQFEAAPAGEERSTLTQTALFEPKGLFGWLYWYGLYPLHVLIFKAMARAIGRDAEAGEA